MGSVQNLRELINERLTAAAVEIFTEFEKTIVQYEEEIDRQRRLLDNIWKLEIKFHTTDLLQQHVQEGNVLSEQNLCNQERNSSVDQDDPDTPQTNEEKLCTSGDGEHLALMQEANTLVQCKSNSVEISREIFGVSDKPLGQLDEEIDYEPRLLDPIWKPRIMLHRIDHPHQDVWKERNGLPHQQHHNQEKTFNLEQEDPTPPQIKEEEDKLNTCLDQKDPETPQITEEPEELCISQQKEQIVVNQATGTFLLTSADKDGDHSEQEPNRDQLLSYNSPVAESPHQEGSQHVDSGSTRNAVLKANECHSRKSSHSKNVVKSSLSESHCDTDTGRKSLNCDVCGNSFENNDQMKHQQNHNSVNPSADNACGKLFHLESDLRVHVIIDKGDRRFSCEICGKRFKKSYELTIHMRTHTGEKPYSCKTCGKSFNQSGNLTDHMRTHTGEKAYCCERCGKKFARLCGLHIHMRTHTGEKPYSCKTCGKSFSQSSNLIVHRKTHTGERAYCCERCGKKFTRLSGLYVHMRTHTGERPYSCKICGKSFNQNGNLNKHMRTHTVETM